MAILEHSGLQSECHEETSEAQEEIFSRYSPSRGLISKTCKEPNKSSAEREYRALGIKQANELNTHL